MQIPAFKLERYFAQYEFNVKYVLCASDCKSCSVQELLDFEPDASERLRQLWLGYTESQGSPALQREISKLYQKIEPRQVLVHAGAEEAIFLFMHAVLDASDHIIVHWPCYQSLFEVARSIGCQVTLWKAREENGWSLDPGELQRHLRSNTKAVVINTPHNPTGYLMPPDTFQNVLSICREKDILLFSDEVYRESEYSMADRLPAACDLGTHTVSLGVMSKTYGLAGLRIGWIATQNADVYSRMAALKDYTTICNSAPSEFLAELALRHRDKLAARNLEIISTNLDLLDQYFDRHSDRFTWQRPRAGAIGFPRLIGRDVDEFCKDLVETNGVLLLPGTLYNDRGNHFRIGFGRKNFSDGLALLDDFLKRSK
ncbi:MAG: aminotransferase class I/II-fold pyridoxal phosphate-dependent enzyme [Deltaproteobacteria bacterium]|jgi:aspartate/methionine/tyrosine aminotransferase|nr:aminotransferase class I/II-fold pyridoxal phosphate-dependent enzyme [Deltaproteobacteria bacterium]